ncbi:hypothetical protein [Burkholderia multivorans]|uniref:hypothetical protein n=1 Tax=Burkholderia multivorans TaxID=87883 RepID=UPI0015887FDC|nr:hypothetical protein [Burkholderia multivorans]
MASILSSQAVQIAVVCIAAVFCVRCSGAALTLAIAMLRPLLSLMLAFSGVVWLAKWAVYRTWGVSFDIWFCAGAIGVVCMLLMTISLLVVNAKGAIERQRELRAGLILEARYPGVKVRRCSGGVWQLVDQASGAVVSEMTSADVSRSVRTGRQN